MNVTLFFLLFLMFSIGIHAIEDAKWNQAKEMSPEMHDVLRESEQLHVEQIELFLSILLQSPTKDIPELVDLVKAHRKKALNEKFLLALLLNNIDNKED